MLIFGRDRELAQWAKIKLGVEDFGPCACIGVAHKGEIVAVAVYNGFAWPNIQVTFVTSSPRWASPGAVRAILRYPFVQLRCKRVTALTESRNLAARAFLERLGFRQEGIHPDAFPSDDGISYGLLARAAARWIEDRHVHANDAPRGDVPAAPAHALQEYAADAAAG
jgi:RimJ/RimL family protein N-acetyltransferase